jgi:PAS domain S-box-containing protein
MESESFRILFGNIPLGVVFLGPDGTAVAVNPRACDIIGLDRENILGRSTKDLGWRAMRVDGSVFPVESYPSVLARATGKPVEGVIMGVGDAQTSRDRWLSVSATPLFLEDGVAVRGVLLTFLDISDKIEAEREIRSLARFPGENPNPVMRISGEGLLVYANKACEKLLTHLGAKVGSPVPEVLSRGCPITNASGECCGFEIKTSDQVYYMMLCAVESGQYYNIYGMDITDRKRVEKTLRQERDFIDAVVRMAGTLVVVLDRTGRIERFNRACEEITGYGFDEAKGRKLWDFLLAPEEKGPVSEQFGRITAGDFPNTYENFWIAKDGRKRLISWSNTALLGDGGEVEFVISTGTDITERREAEKTREREMHSFEAMSAPLPAGVTAATLGLMRLSEAEPGFFERLTCRFSELLDQSVEMLALKVEHDLSGEIASISEALGAVRAGPRDATEIFLAALKRNCAGALPEKCRAYREEGRIMLIELIGKLAAFYRNHCLGMAPAAGAPGVRINGGRP